MTVYPPPPGRPSGPRRGCRPGVPPPRRVPPRPAAARGMRDLDGSAGVRRAGAGETPRLRSGPAPPRKEATPGTGHPPIPSLPGSGGRSPSRRARSSLRPPREGGGTGPCPQAAAWRSSPAADGRGHSRNCLRRRPDRSGPADYFLFAAGPRTPAPHREASRPKAAIPPAISPPSPRGNRLLPLPRHPPPRAGRGPGPSRFPPSPRRSGRGSTGREAGTGSSVSTWERIAEASPSRPRIPRSPVP